MNRELTILMAGAMLFPVLAFAQPAQGPGGRRPSAAFRERMFDRLGLSDEQRAKVRKLSLDHQKAQTELMAKIRIARLDLREMLLADKPDRSSLEKQISAISELQNQSKIARLHHLFAVFDLLTPEQQKKFKSHMSGSGEGPGRGERGGSDHWMGSLTGPGPDEGPVPDEDAPPAPEPDQH